MSDNLISKQTAYEVLSEYYHHKTEMQHKALKKALDMVPTVDVPDRNVGKWLEREVIHAKEAKAIITEWQSCKCSVCGCYDTRPYLYCFNEPRFCSWCGAEMKGVSDE